MTTLPAMGHFPEAGTDTMLLWHDILLIIASRYERCRPGDTFEDLCNRARFSKEDRRLLEDWLAAFGAGIARFDGQGEAQ